LVLPVFYIKFSIKAIS